MKDLFDRIIEILREDCSNCYTCTEAELINKAGYTLIEHTKACKLRYLLEANKK